MKYCMYLRKSRADIDAEARGEGETLARHEKMLIEVAKKLNLTITMIYREIVSGETIAARPIMQQLLSEVESGEWSGVLVVEVERLARGNTLDQGIVAQAFKFSNTKIITPIKTYDPSNEFDEEYFEFGLFMSRREYKTINRRLQNGRIASVKDGKYLGNKPPYGYSRVKIPNDKGYTLEPNPNQDYIVKMVFQLYTVGKPLQDGSFRRLGVSLICRYLNDLKIPTANGGAWVPATIQGMLRNPVYIGKIRWGSRARKKRVVNGTIKTERPRAASTDFIVSDGIHEPLIDEITFNIAQKYLSHNPPSPAKRDGSIKSPLAGLVVCGFCGRKMVRKPYKNKYPDTLMCSLTSCENVSSHLHLVEEKIIQSLEYWLSNSKLNLNLLKSNNNDSCKDTKKSALKSIEREILDYEKQIERIYTLLEQGVYTTEVFLERSKVVSNNLDEFKKKKELIEIELKEELELEESQNNLIPNIEKALEVYKSSKNAADKNEVLKSVIDRVIYKKKNGGRWGDPNDFEIVLYPIKKF